MIVEISPWTIEHSGDARERLAEIRHETKPTPVDGHMLDAGWDGRVGHYSRAITEDDLREALTAWIAEFSADYLAELPYLP